MLDACSLQVFTTIINQGLGQIFRSYTFYIWRSNETSFQKLNEGII